MPDPTLSEAMKEAYASADPDVPILETLSFYFDGQLDEDGNPADLFIFNGNNPTFVSPEGIPYLSAKLEASAPRNAGEVVSFTGIPFQITLLGVSTEAAPRAMLAVDNINQETVDLLIEAAQGGKSVSVTFRQYLVGSESAGPENDPPIVFNWVDVEVVNQQASGRLVPPTVGNRRFPFETYVPSRFRTLSYA